MAARKKSTRKKAPAKPRSKGGRPTKRTAETEAVILGVIGSGLSLDTAADRAQVDRSTVLRWMQQDDGFATAVRKARSEASESVAASLLRNALDGNVQAQQFWLTRRTKEFREAKDQPLDITVEGVESVSDLGSLAVQVLAAALRDGAPGSAVQAVAGAITGAAKAQEVTELRAELENLRAEVRRVTDGADGDG